jgi:hypothetical protein
MNRRSKQDRVMQELFDEISPAYTEQIRLLRSDAITQGQFRRDGAEILDNNFHWLVKCCHVRPKHAQCMILTVVRLIHKREGLEPDCSSADLNSEKQQLAIIITKEVAECSNQPLREEQLSGMRRYVLMLLNRYSNLRESCASLFQSADNGDGPSDDVRPTPVKERNSMEDWEERDVIQVLFNWVWKDYKEPIVLFKTQSISWKKLTDEWRCCLVERFYKRLTERFILPPLEALSMVQTVGLFVRQQLGVAPIPEQGAYLDHQEFLAAKDLTSAVISDLEREQRTTANKQKVYDIIAHLIADYRGKLRRRRRKR